MNFYISDLHMNHKNILSFDKRPFKSLEIMNQELVKRWNSVVTNADHVYVLGDFIWDKGSMWPEFLKRFNGNIHLIQGNHDLKQYGPEVMKYLVEVTPYKEIKDGPFTIIMSHFPMCAWKHDYDDSVFHFYGHVHTTKEWQVVRDFSMELRDNYNDVPDNRGQMINIGCMMPWMNYTPQTAEYLIKMFDEWKVY